MLSLDDAMSLAEQAHAGQVDKQGRDYFTHHLIPVVSRAGEIALVDFDGMPSDEVQHILAVAWLHDLLEDTRWTVEKLEEVAGPRLAGDVLILTHQPGLTYAAYIEFICSHFVPRLVKLADNSVNLRDCPSPSLEKRYLAARARLAFD